MPFVQVLPNHIGDKMSKATFGWEGMFPNLNYYNFEDLKRIPPSKQGKFYTDHCNCIICPDCNGRGKLPMFTTLGIKRKDTQICLECFGTGNVTP